MPEPGVNARFRKTSVIPGALLKKEYAVVLPPPECGPASVDCTSETRSRMYPPGTARGRSIAAAEMTRHGTIPAQTRMRFSVIAFSFFQLASLAPIRVTQLTQRADLVERQSNLTP